MRSSLYAKNGTENKVFNINYKLSPINKFDLYSRKKRDSQPIIGILPYCGLFSKNKQSQLQRPVSGTVSMAIKWTGVDKK